MVEITNKQYNSAQEFKQDLSNVANSTRWFSFYSAQKNGGIKEIGLWEKMCSVVGSWMLGQEDPSSTACIDRALGNICVVNEGLIKSDPDVYTFICKVAMRAKLISVDSIQEDSSLRIQEKADHINGVATLLRQFKSVKKPAPLSKKNITPITSSLLVETESPQLSTKQNIENEQEETSTGSLLVKEANPTQPSALDIPYNPSKQKENLPEPFVSPIVNSLGQPDTEEARIEISITEEEKNRAHRAGGNEDRGEHITTHEEPVQHMHRSGRYRAIERTEEVKREKKPALSLGGVLKVLGIVGAGIGGIFLAGRMFPTLNPLTPFDDSSLYIPGGDLAQSSTNGSSLINEAFWKSHTVIQLNTSNLMNITNLKDLVEAPPKFSKPITDQNLIQDEVINVEVANLFELLSSEKTLIKKESLSTFDSILSYFMTEEVSWKSHQELEAPFEASFKRFQTREIAETCLNLMQAYKEGDNDSGYYLLWIIKKVTGCEYQIPEKKSFTSSSVSKALDNQIASIHLNESSIEDIQKLIELLNFKPSVFHEPIYRKFLSPHVHDAFLTIIVKQLKNIAIDRWPNKAEFLIDFLEGLTPQRRSLAVLDIASSIDPATAEIGKHFLAVLKAGSFKESIPHFNSLINLVPTLDSKRIQKIFDQPFPGFCIDNIYYKDLDFVKRLSFNDKVFVYDSLIIGVYKSGKMAPHLLAYNMNGENMVWGIPLTSGLSAATSLEYNLEKVGKYISLQFAGEKKVHFINSQTGNYDFAIELPAAFDPEDFEDNGLHISSEGFAYQMVNKGEEFILIGGKIVDKKWNTSFESVSPPGLFQPLSTHCGFQKDSHLVLVGPTGDQATIENCWKAQADGDKLYTIEIDPLSNKHLLRVRTLKVSSEVVSQVEKTVSLNVTNAFFGDFYRNDQLILFSEEKSTRTPIFIDLNNQKVMYGQHGFSRYADYKVNKETGELWTWDEVSKKIWKIDPTKITLMGSMEGNRGTILLHVDKTDHLYIEDIPF